MKRDQRTKKKLSLILAAVACATTLPWLAFAGHGVEDTVDNLSVERVKQLVDAAEKLVFIDLRPTKEFQQTRLPGARTFPIAEVASRFN